MRLFAGPGTRRALAALFAAAITLATAGAMNTFAEGGGETPSWLEGGGSAAMEDLSGDSGEEDEDGGDQIIALYRTNILNAEDGLGTGRYTLAIPNDSPLDESDPTLAAAATLTRRLIRLDGSLGDPSDGSPLNDVEATVDAGFADVYAVMAGDRSIFIYKNGEQVVAEETSGHYTKITYTRNLKGQPALRYTRANGKTALYTFSTGCVALFTGDYINLTIDYAMGGMAVAFGSGCRIEELHVNSRILLHNSGLVEDGDYPPDGIELIGVALDEDQNPVLIDSGMWAVGPRPARGRLCAVCKTEYNSKIASQYELHLVHECEWPDCKNGGLWASCAPEGGLYDPALHGPAPWCPYGLCAVCSDIRCDRCQADIAAGKASAITP
ncbi:MAG: hypothetical protein LBH66_04190 [Oscillospiraceae bacterium]|jgi:hypothetical protein|nr:hypothetical protein [Oscillospiraceae bacterium]